MPNPLLDLPFNMPEPPERGKALTAAHEPHLSRQIGKIVHNLKGPQP